MTRKLALPDVNDLYARYQAGESSVDLANHFGCHSSTLRNLFEAHGLPMRTFRELQLMLNAKRTPERRREIAASANAAARGRKAGLAERCARALMRERFRPQMSTAEQRVYQALKATGVAITRERACGPYNIDFAVGHSVAVECFAGGWHAVGGHAARFQKRTRYLFDCGWDVVIVWLDRNGSSEWIGRLEHQITSLQSAGREPAAPRQYRMIFSDGEEVSCCSDIDHIPMKRPGKLSRDPATGRYYRSW